jgi:NADH-quinone oxidoreductase subunit F
MNPDVPAEEAVVNEATTLISIVDDAFDRVKDQTPLDSALIPLLQAVQNALGYLPAPALQRIARLLRLSESQVLGVATFYHQFQLRPTGQHVITLCQGTACHVANASEIHQFLVQHLQIPPHDDTSPDGVFTIQRVRCLGACSLAPILKIDDDIYGHVTLPKLPRLLAQYTRHERTNGAPAPSANTEEHPHAPHG